MCPISTTFSGDSGTKLFILSSIQCSEQMWSLNLLQHFMNIILCPGNAARGKKLIENRAKPQESEKNKQRPNQAPLGPFPTCELLGPLQRKSLWARIFFFFFFNLPRSTNYHKWDLSVDPGWRWIDLLRSSSCKQVVRGSGNSDSAVC